MFLKSFLKNIWRLWGRLSHTASFSDVCRGPSSDQCRRTSWGASGKSSGLKIQDHDDDEWYPDNKDEEASGQEEEVSEHPPEQPEGGQAPIDELKLGVGPRHQVPALELLSHKPRGDLVLYDARNPGLDIVQDVPAVTSVKLLITKTEQSTHPSSNSRCKVSNDIWLTKGLFFSPSSSSCSSIFSALSIRARLGLVGTRLRVSRRLIRLCLVTFLPIWPSLGLFLTTSFSFDDGSVINVNFSPLSLFHLNHLHPLRTHPHYLQSQTGFPKPLWLCWMFFSRTERVKVWQWQMNFKRSYIQGGFLFYRYPVCIFVDILQLYVPQIWKEEFWHKSSWFLNFCQMKQGWASLWSQIWREEGWGEWWENWRKNKCASCCWCCLKYFMFYLSPAKIIFGLSQFITLALVTDVLTLGRQMMGSGSWMGQDSGLKVELCLYWTHCL